MSLLMDLSAYLVAQTLAGGSTGWNLVRRRIVDEPDADQLIVLNEDGGSTEVPAVRGVGDAAMHDIGVQCLVRGPVGDSDASLTRAELLREHFHGKLNLTMNGHVYLRAMARTPEPLFIGFDERSRPQHTISFLFLTHAA